MNKIDQLFQSTDKPVLSIYITAGYPQLNSLGTILTALEKAGVDMVEIGMPFSDPLADGPVIQEASQVALRNGMNLEILFQQMSEIKVKMPLILMGYLNPVLQYGLDRFQDNQVRRILNMVQLSDHHLNCVPIPPISIG